MSKGPTIQQLAREAGVSRSTVDRILNTRGEVKRATVEHVLIAAERIGFYATNSIRERLSDATPERTFGFLLNSRQRRLYNRMGEVVLHETRRVAGNRSRALIRYLDDLDPDRAAQELLALGEECDAIACVCIGHPQINLAISRLARQNVPVIAMVSALSSTDCAGFVGSNDWQIGRTAGWMMDRLTPPDARIAVLVGSDRYLCQQAHEAAFRNFLRLSKPQAEILPTTVTDEADTTAGTRIEELVRRHKELDGIFVAGSGLEAISEFFAGHTSKKPVLVGTEITELTRDYLSINRIDAILDNPVYDIARRAVEVLASIETSRMPSRQIRELVPFHLLVSENC